MKTYCTYLWKELWNLISFLKTFEYFRKETYMHMDMLQEFHLLFLLIRCEILLLERVII